MQSFSFYSIANMTTQTMPLAADTAILSTRNVLALVGVWVVYKVLQALYNISPLHPLSGIPGPKLAAASYAVEFWYDVVRFGCYTKEIRKMHVKYGKPPPEKLEVLNEWVSNFP
jgi:hypothetical protein